MFTNSKKICLCFLIVSFCSCNNNNNQSKTPNDSGAISVGFDYNDSKESPIFFLAAKSERDFVSETNSLFIDFYFGHDFYVGSYYRDNFENESFEIALKTNDEVLYTKTIADFNDKKYDCVEDKKLDFKENFVTIEFSWEKLNAYNSNSIPFILSINRVSYTDWSSPKFYFSFIKENAVFKFKSTY